MDKGNGKMDVKQKLREMSAELDDAIRSHIADEEPSNLIEAVRQYPYAGGKRMRPSMVVSACRAVGGDASGAIPMAVAIEYIHNFTLVHDDLMDGDEMRRGMQTSHVRYGLQTSILAGDALFAKAYQIIASLDIPSDAMRRVMEVTSKAVWDLARGQQMDVNNENAPRITLEHYIETIRLKTSVLFAAGAASGAIIGGADDDIVESIHDYAMDLGIAFQMYDDILGVYGDPEKTGKSAGNDIRKGKYTVMICHALDSLDDETRGRFMSVFGKIDATDDEIACARSILKECGSYDYAIDMADEYTTRAIDRLGCLADSEDKEFMIELARYSMSRDV